MLWDLEVPVERGGAWDLRWSIGSTSLQIGHPFLLHNVWWSGCKTAGVNKRLSREQRLACWGITRAILTTPIGAMEALTGLPSLGTVIQSAARSEAHCLWSLWCWSYLHPNRGYSSVLLSLLTYGPIFNYDASFQSWTLIYGHWVD